MISELLTSCRSWQVVRTDHGWRGAIYGPDGATPSLETPDMDSPDEAMAALELRWAWLQEAA